jgi:hypothetical protein
MKIRGGRQSSPSNRSARALSIFHFLFSIFLFAGCGAPGDPTPPSPPVPVAIDDVSVHQIGDGVHLSFALPAKTVRGATLATPPAVEILRGTMRPDGTPDAKSFRVVYTIPGAMIDNYLGDGRVEFTDPVSPEEAKAHPGAVIAYRVRTRASQKRASADSNTVTLRLVPVSERISSLDARVTKSAIELTWRSPTRTSAGDPLPAAIGGYHVYRGELDPASADAAAKDPAQAKYKSRPALLASPSENKFSDTEFEFGKTYFYTVRSVRVLASSNANAASGEANAVESADSAPAIVTPRDVFPPAPPQAPVAAVLPGATPSSLVVDLSWSISPEPDLAGYRVYRSEAEGTRGDLLTPDLLPTPTLRDTSVQPGHRYWYTITAVDRAGNESQPSVQISVDVAQPSQ